jgi:hypothetical protein
MPDIAELARRAGAHIGEQRAQWRFVAGQGLLMELPVSDAREESVTCPRISPDDDPD